ncbi:MAG: hypothetical protein KF819_08930 [Labilithrix sp.]|nr:hypothetical protein [Labilithrix sp.]
MTRGAPPAPIRFEIRCTNMEVSMSLEDHVEHALVRALGRHRRRVHSMLVRFGVAATGTHCHVTARLLEGALEARGVATGGEGAVSRAAEELRRIMAEHARAQAT